MKNPKIAVLLAAYNGARYIEEQLETILMQESVDIKIFISVDLSQDNTYDLCVEFSKLHGNIVTLPYGAQFGGAAENFFRLIRDVDFSEYDYISFADQDDIWSSTKLSHALFIMKKFGVDGYSSNVTAFWPDGRKFFVEKSQPQRQWDFLFEAAGPGCTYVMTRKLGSAVQDLVCRRWVYIQQVSLHDWFVYAFARANGYRWAIDAYSGMLYRQHGANQVGVNFGWRAFVSRAKKILSGWGLAQSLLIAELVGVEKDVFVERWSDRNKIGLLWLALRAGQCRRRTRDKFLFALSCVAMCIAGDRRL
jgi:rhamnosyltransferase